MHSYIFHMYSTAPFELHLFIDPSWWQCFYLFESKSFPSDSLLLRPSSVVVFDGNSCLIEICYSKNKANLLYSDGLAVGIHLMQCLGWQLRGKRNSCLIKDLQNRLVNMIPWHTFIKMSKDMTRRADLPIYHSIVDETEPRDRLLKRKKRKFHYRKY